MKMVPVQSAIGMVLCHDVTQTIPGRMDRPAFRKSHILREQDVHQPLIEVLPFRSFNVGIITTGLLAGEEIARRDIVAMAHGGVCAYCMECRYPDCGFAKGA